MIKPGIRKNKWTISEFITRSNYLHNNKYDYTLVNFKNNKSRIEIVCPTHGKFIQRMETHLRGIGCSLCVGKNIQKTNIQFIEQCFDKNKTWDYSKVLYKNNKTKVVVICNDCKTENKVSPLSILRGIK